MFLEKAAQWENLLDLAALFSSCLVFLFLAWNRIRYRRWVMGVPATAPTDPCFGAELTAELLRQRVRKTREAISHALEQELDSFVEGVSGGNGLPAAVMGALDPPVDGGGGAPAPQPDGMSGERDSDYHFAFKIAARGASVESIRSHAGLTEGEAELIFNLQRFQAGN